MDFLTKYEQSVFSRTTTVLTKTDASPVLNYSGSLDTMGGGFILLGAKLLGGNPPAVLRLYSNQSSMIVDQSRPIADFNINDAVALITEIQFDDIAQITFNPPIIGNTLDGGYVWYNLSGSSGNLSVEVQSYAIRDLGDSISGNGNLIISRSSVPTSGVVSGNITTPKSFLILTGSATQQSRLRLYSRPYTEVSANETSRAFTTQPNSGSLLIADLMFDSASFRYPLVPLLEGYTWKTNEFDAGSNLVGYHLENMSGVVNDVTASLYVYSTED